MVPVFKNVEERSTADICSPVSIFLWLVKFEELVNNRTVDHQEKCGLF